MSVYTPQDLRTMQAWPLERKIQVTQAKIMEWYMHYEGKVAVSFSGGKDSTVLLDLARRAFPDIRATFVDTGLEYPEIREFVKTVPNVTWLRPDMSFHKVIEKYGYPVISKEVAKRIYYARNGLILGTPGSGKSFSAKREILNVFLVTDDDILICDPEGEYFPIVQRLCGQVIRISPTSDDYINPMDI